jgi:hypothetical protein
MMRQRTRRPVVTIWAGISMKDAKEPEQHADGGRLSGAVWADEAAYGAGSNAKGKPVDRLAGAVGLREAVEMDCR